MESKKSFNESGWGKFFWFVLAISLSFNALLFIKRAEVFPSKRALIHENMSLDSLSNKYRNELYKYRGISKRIDNIIAEGAAQLKVKEQQIRALYRSNRELDKENKNLVFQLDSLQNNFMNTIDSLLVERENIDVVNEKITGMEETIAGLNKKLGLARLLIGDNVSVKPLKGKTNGKMQATAIARKVTDIQVCMDIIANKIANPGLRNIYVVITSPSAKVIAQGEGSAPQFQHPDYKTTAECTKIDKLVYKNQSLQFCTQIIPNEQLEAGVYVLEIFTDENKLATTTFTLK